MFATSLRADNQASSLQQQADGLAHAVRAFKLPGASGFTLNPI